MTAFEYTVSDYKLTCEIVDEAIMITDIRGKGSSLEIPGQIEYQGKNYAVCHIGKKAMLGNRTIRDVKLPGNVTYIGDWAFAQCLQLTTLLMSENTELGVGVFEDCFGLVQICKENEDHQSSKDLSFLLAACVKKLPSEDLLQDKTAGSSHWYQKWDQRLEAFLNENDKEGYQKMILCGEEDIRKGIPEYIFDKQKKKAGLCMMRLLHNECLEIENRERYIRYILTHGKGCESEAAWKVMTEQYSDCIIYLNLLADIGGITEKNVDAMIEDLTQQQAEAKAYLIRFKQEHFKKQDVFSQFEL